MKYLEQDIAETSPSFFFLISYTPNITVTTGEEVDKLLAERAELQAQIKAQKMTEVEISQMYSDAETLQKQNATLNEKLAQVKQALHELEVGLARRVDTVEEDIGIYMSLLEKVGLVGGPTTAATATATTTSEKDDDRSGITLPKSIQDVEFRIELNMARGDPSSSLPSEAMLVPAASPASAIAPTVDLRKLIKPALGEYRKAKTEEMQRITGEIIELEHEIEEVEGKVEDLRERIGSCEEERALTNAQIDSMKEVSIDCNLF